MGLRLNNVATDVPHAALFTGTYLKSNRIVDPINAFVIDGEAFVTWVHPQLLIPRIPRKCRRTSPHRQEVRTVRKSRYSDEQIAAALR